MFFDEFNDSWRIFDRLSRLHSQAGDYRFRVEGEVKEGNSIGLAGFTLTSFAHSFSSG